jgi:hypothetical protein
MDEARGTLKNVVQIIMLFQAEICNPIDMYIINIVRH